MASIEIRGNGNPEPIPSGEIARKKIIAPILTKRTNQPLRIMPMAINACPNDI